MRNPISNSIAAVGFFGVALAILGAPAQAQSERGDTLPYPFFFFCRSDAPMGMTFYFSSTQPIAAGVKRQDLQNSFHDFLAAKYKYPINSAVSCVYATGPDLQARTESNRKETIANLHMANFGVVETDWKFAN